APPLPLRRRRRHRPHGAPVGLAPPDAPDAGPPPRPPARCPRARPRPARPPPRLTMPATTSALDAIHIGNGHAPELPENLSAERLRALARLASYAPGRVPRERLTVRAPFTGEAVASLPAAAAEDVRDAFARARR